jgi:ketosteroid isomerase-like protein
VAVLAVRFGGDRLDLLYRRLDSAPTALWTASPSDLRTPSTHGPSVGRAGAVKVAPPLSKQKRGWDVGQNADIVRTAWDAFLAADIEGAAATTADDAEIVIPETLPWGGTYHGPDGLKEMIMKLLGTVAEARPQPNAFLEAEDNQVVTPVTGWLRSKSGKELTESALWLYTIRDGKVSRAEFFSDTAGIRDTLA